jgi:hypothetical protein
MASWLREILRFTQDDHHFDFCRMRALWAAGIDHGLRDGV